MKEPRLRPRTLFTLLVLVVFALAPAARAAKPGPASRFEILPDQTETSFVGRNMRISRETGVPLALYRVGYQARAGSPEEMARQYLAANARLLRLAADHLPDLEHRITRPSPVGHTVRFRQHLEGVPVYRAEIAVTVNHHDVVTFVTNGYRPGVALDSVQPALAPERADRLAREYLAVEGPLDHEEIGLVVYHSRGSSRLAYRAVLVPRLAPSGDWELLVDAVTGEILRAEDRTLHVDGTGPAFLPDPLSSALATYGDPGYVDGNDADTPQLLAEIGTVGLLDITFGGGLHSLIGPWAECGDFEGPFKGCFAQASSDFSFTREQDGFEATNTYYDIDTFMRYMNDTLGVDVHPYQYPGGVQFDPHGLNGADNSHYITSTGRLAFGEGGVDDAEDADVVIHELGHGIHDWVTVGGLSQVEGLSEGVGDYFAQSYSRGFPGQWQPADPEYDWVFHWDGHNPFWPGRVTDWNDGRIYPDDLVGQIHTDGQFWSSCNIDIAEIIGLEATDTAMLVGLSMTGGGSNQLDAAQAVLQAAVDLGYTGGQLAVIESVYQGCGYEVSAPDLIFADGFESGDTTAWSSTVP